MSEMLKAENIQFLDRVTDWQEAVREAVKPLIIGGYCTADYADGIITNTYEFGPYYVLCENFALLHARPEQGVLKKQLAVTILKEPVRFKADGLDVRILVTLAATDSESHIKAMQAISTIFSSQENINRLLQMTSEEAVLALFNQSGLETKNV